MMGMKMPPARAVDEGMAGDSSSSATVRSSIGCGQAMLDTILQHSSKSGGPQVPRLGFLAIRFTWHNQD